MRSLLHITPLLLALGLAVGAGGDDRRTDHLDVDALIAQLGDRRYARRHSATRELLQRGREAVAALRRAARSPDYEVAWRAQAVLRAQGLLGPREGSEASGSEVDPEDVPRGEVRGTIYFNGTVIRKRFNPDTRRIEFDIGGRRYPVSTLGQLARRYPQVWRQLRTGPTVVVRQQSDQLQWPAVGVRVKPGSPFGLEVTNVMPQSPAAQFGLRVGDRLVAIDGSLILSSEAMTRSFRQIQAGQAFALVVIREDRRHQLLGVRQR